METSAVIYTRFSPRPSPEESRSLEVQENDCRAYCTLRNLNVLSVIYDAEQSAHQKDLSESPGGKQVLELIKRVGLKQLFHGEALTENLKKG